MPLEIEHRFLVNNRQLPRKLPRGERLEQGFLSLEPVVRVRIITPTQGKPRARLTIKGRGLRIRQEFEYTIPVTEARKLLKLCGNRTLAKTRRRLGGWELDEFHGRHKGLWLAELELPDARTRLPRPLPAWIAREVTSDPRYTNARLVLLKRWHPNTLR